MPDLKNERNENVIMPKKRFSPTIRFSELWWKLQPENFKIGGTLTTFRGYKPDKDAYYRREKDSMFYVVLEEEQNGRKTEPLLLGTAKLKSIEYKWSSELSLEEIKRDTYEYWTIKDFESFLKKQYGIEVVYGLLLTFEVTDVHMMIDSKS